MVRNRFIMLVPTAKTTFYLVLDEDFILIHIHITTIN